MNKLLPLLFLAPAAVLAAEVSTASAARAAAAWVDRGYAMGTLPAGRVVSAVDAVEDPATGARLLVAKFEGGGYVVLSADDRIDPVLAFSETGDGIDPDDSNPFWALLRGDIAAREAAAGVERGGAARRGRASVRSLSPQADPEPTAAQRKWADLLFGADSRPAVRGADAPPSDIRVDSFLESRWNQGTATHYEGSTDYCYNYYTPNHYYAGCVATALSQVMRFFRHPTSPVIATNYPCMVDGVSTNMTMMGGTYDWDDMPARPWESGTTEAQRQAIGKIVYDVGVTVGMNWTANGSGASAYTGQSALMEDFGYAQACAIPYHTNAYPWSLTRFKSNVVPCLDARSPVVVSIHVSSDPDNGHAVLADGYGYSDGAFCLHVNFGWGYEGDSRTAWYCPPDFQTGENYGYDVIDGILCNIFPDRTGNVFSGRVLDADGNPVADATVSLSGRNETATTDANGIYAFVAPAGSYTATAYKDGVSASVDGVLTQTSTVFPDGRTAGYYWHGICCGNAPDNDIVLNGLESAPPPVFDPGSCLFYPTTNVTITCVDEGIEIRYTLDGSTPTENSFFYSGPDPQTGQIVNNGPITVDKTVTIRARTFTPGKNPSPVVSATYTYDASRDAPEGDYFADPIPLSGSTGQHVIPDNSDYTVESGEPSHSTYDQFKTIWFQWTAPGSGTMKLQTEASYEVPAGEQTWIYSCPTFIAVYTGDALGSLVQIAQAETGTCWDEDKQGYYFEDSTSLALSVQQGTTYRIATGLVYWDEPSEFKLFWSLVQKTGYETWAETLPVEIGGPADITDGVENAFRYVFGKPTGAFSPILSAVPGPSGGSTLLLPTVYNTNGITLKVQSTTNLLDWTPAAVDERTIPFRSDGVIELPFGGDTRFFRLKAEVE